MQKSWWYIAVRVHINNLSLAARRKYEGIECRRRRPVSAAFIITVINNIILSARDRWERYILVNGIL